jgi:hypothetical protein
MIVRHALCLRTMPLCDEDGVCQSLSNPPAKARANIQAKGESSMLAPGIRFTRLLPITGGAYGSNTEFSTAPFFGRSPMLPTERATLYSLLMRLSQHVRDADA